MQSICAFRDICAICVTKKSICVRLDRDSPPRAKQAEICAICDFCVTTSRTPRPSLRISCWVRGLPGCAKRSWGCLHRRCHLLHKAPQTPHTALAPTLASCHYSSPIYRSKGRSLQFIDFQGWDECLSHTKMQSPFCAGSTSILIFGEVFCSQLRHFLYGISVVVGDTTIFKAKRFYRWT